MEFVKNSCFQTVSVLLINKVRSSDRALKWLKLGTN